MLSAAIGALPQETREALLRGHLTVDALAVGVATDSHTLSRQARMSAEGLACLSRQLLCRGDAPLPRTGLSVMASFRQAGAQLSTGVDDIDWMLGGGLATGEVTELLGMPGAGKTQLCLQACAAQAASAGASALYFDINGQFSAKRLYSFLVASARGSLSRAQCKSRLEQRVKVVTSPDLPSLLDALDNLNADLTSIRRSSAQRDHSTGGAAADAVADDSAWYNTLRLIVLDSVFDTLLSEHTGAAGSFAGTQLLRLRHRLRQLARRHGIAVVVTNAMAPAKSLGSLNERRLTVARPAFGHAWDGAAHIYLLVRKPQSMETVRDDRAEQGQADDGCTSYVTVRSCSLTHRSVQVSAEVCVKYALDGQISSGRLTHPHAA
jgi:RecA/RadA recombinase